MSNENVPPSTTVVKEVVATQQAEVAVPKSQPTEAVISGPSHPRPISAFAGDGSKSDVGKSRDIHTTSRVIRPPGGASSIIFG